MADIKASVIRPLVWMGNSKKNIQAFPVEAQKDMGDEIQLIQFGGMPKDAKPFKGVGSGVFEIALRHDTNAYRAVLAGTTGRENLCPARLSEKISERNQDGAGGHRPDKTTIQGSSGACRP